MYTLKFLLLRPVPEKMCCKNRFPQLTNSTNEQWQTALALPIFVLSMYCFLRSICLTYYSQYLIFSFKETTSRQFHSDTWKAPLTITWLADQYASKYNFDHWSRLDLQWNLKSRLLPKDYFASWKLLVSGVDFILWCKQSRKKRVPCTKLCLKFIRAIGSCENNLHCRYAALKRNSPSF